MTPREIMDSEAPHIVLTVTRPPSANALWKPVLAHGSRKPILVKSDAYKAWLFAAGLTLNVQAAGQQVPGMYALRIACPVGFDVDNHAKPCGDLLQKCKVVTNDKLCERNVQDRDRTVAPGTVRLELWAVDA